VPEVTVGEHFERVAAVYESLRTTDEAPVRRIARLLPDRPVTGLDVGCGTGRYSRLLRGLLPDGSLLVGSDVSAAMLAQLNAGNHGRAVVVPLVSAAEELPLRTASLDLVTAFNCVHHFDLGRFLTAVARVLQPGGQLFIYTRTPQQNARTIWGRYFPGFTEHERRLHSEAALRDAVRQTDGLTVVAAQTFRHPRSSTAGRLRAQAEGHHYSTFSLYTPDELRASIAAFLARLPGPEVSWVDEHLLVVIGGSRRSQAEPDGSSSLASWASFQPVGDLGDSTTRAARRAVTLEPSNPGAVTLRVDGKSRTALGSQPVTLSLAPGHGTSGSGAAATPTGSPARPGNPQAACRPARQVMPDRRAVRAGLPHERDPPAAGQPTAGVGQWLPCQSGGTGS
jgi:SAM-dependent methyltransferase